MPLQHSLSASPETVHWGYFDASLAPRLTVDSGDTVTLHCVSGGPVEIGVRNDLLPEHRAILAQLQPHLGPHILTGPVAVRGAEPGDTLEVRIKSVELRADWSYNGIKPLKGTLPEDFPLLRILQIPLDRANMTATLPFGPAVPLRPFMGIMAVAPRAECGAVSSIEPREFGGNIDCKELVAGTTLFLPVWAPGALFSCGDGHAAQGDGEVNLMALETPMSGTFELILHKNKTLTFPRALTPTHYISFGTDPDLDDAAKQALREMIKWLVELKGWAPEDAYTFCSIACDLRVTQLVDGFKGIHAMVARALID
ncbi:MAG: acetamidase/formamidase family protein [Burkholderiales bacterium]|jgi:acetamidase/formamidase|nr:acetamidase/formamidase family protein [Gallionella sp.]